MLTAKLQAVLRRSYDFAAPLPVLECRGARLSPTDSILELNGQQAGLTRNEYRILHTLMEQVGQVVSREKLMERLWETDSFVDENTLTVNIARLREKAGGMGLSDFITTRKGMGYVVKEAESREAADLLPPAPRAGDCSFWCCVWGCAPWSLGSTICPWRRWAMPPPSAPPWPWCGWWWISGPTPPRHRCLAALQREITVTLEHLPRPRNDLEADYQALLQALDARAGSRGGQLGNRSTGT